MDPLHSMANFTAIVDEDHERRGRYVREVEPIIAPVPNLGVGRLDCGAFCAIWAVGAHAPLSTWQDGTQAGIIFGDAIDHGSATRVSARGLIGEGRPDAGLIPPTHDGYYAAVTFSAGALAAGSDLLGLFPLYYAAGSDFVIVSTTPELILRHPSIRPLLSEEGLAGILLIDALVQNRTIWRDIYRLRAAHALIWRAAAGAIQVAQYELPGTRRPATRSFRADVEELHCVIHDAVRRHADSTLGLLLSGGRDSRQLAGCLADLGLQPATLTMGEPGDYEVRLARQVTRVLGWSHQSATVQSARFPETAALHAAWDHLGSGFSSPHLWGMIEPLRAFAPRLMTGYLADLVTGGSALKPVSRTGRRISAVIFEWANRRGVPSGTLKRLVHREDLIAFVTESVQAEFESACVPEQEQFWRYQLAATERLRVGGMPWRFSFGSWPVVPVIDRAVLDVVATLPVDSLVNRRAQDEILRTRFPKLARVPHVLWNADVQLPLLPHFGHRLRHRLKRIEQKLPLKRPDRRYTWRMYDFNGPGWQLIRRRAEPNRERLGAWFDLDALAEYLPPPHLPVASPTFESTMGRKLLVGLMLWAETHVT